MCVCQEFQACMNYGCGTCINYNYTCGTIFMYIAVFNLYTSQGVGKGEVGVFT